MLLLQLPIALSSLLITCKNEERKERQKKQRKQRTSGRFFSPTTNFLVGNYELRRAERWDDMPSTSSEVGEIYEVCLRMVPVSNTYWPANQHKNQ